MTLAQDATLKSFTIAPGKAGIYVYRNESIGGAVKMDLAIDGQDIGQTAAKTYLYSEVGPGFHTIVSRSENTDSVGVDAKPGSLTYIWQEVKMGALYARTKLHLVDEAEGRKGVQESRLAMTKSLSPAGSGLGAPFAAKPAAAATPSVASAATLAGVRMTFLDKDPISKSPAGETTLVLMEVTSTQRVYNDGALITTLDGTPIKGSAHSTMIYGVGPRELQRGGTWDGMYRAANVSNDVPATFTVVGKQTKVISGQRFEATRIRIEGYAARTGINGGQSSTNGAVFNGEALIDNATSLVLEIEVRCRHPSYPLLRELIRVSGLS